MYACHPRSTEPTTHPPSPPPKRTGPIFLPNPALWGVTQQKEIRDELEPIIILWCVDTV